MQAPATTTALLFFSRSPAAEALAKPILGSANSTKANLLLHKLLQQKTQRLLKSSGLPLFNWNESQQTAEGFGARLREAVQHVFSQGHKKVLIVGNDSPQLSSQQVNQALRLLQENELVLGATPQGGAYLIGLSQKNFSAAAFENLAWQSPALAEELSHFLNTQSVAKLPLLSDVNNHNDLLCLAQQAILDPSLRFLLGFYRAYQRPKPSLALYHSFSLKRPALRGPPAVLAFS